MDQRNEILINIWNGEFPNYTLTVPDLKKPHAMLGACLYVFQRLGIDNEAILTPPPEEERDANMIYYWDLLPVINLTRVINHIISVLRHSDKLSNKFPLPITYFLQPEAGDSHTLLLLLVNLMAFNENRLKEISSQVADLFGKRDQVKALEDKKNRLIEALNQQAEEKGKRAERLERVDTDIQHFGEELQKEKEAHEEEKQELEACLKEKQQQELLLDQKRTHRDALIAEVNRKKALRVYDVEDILAQCEQAAQNVREAEEKLESLKSSLMQKESCLKNLQKLKPDLDVANILLSDIVSLSEELSSLSKDHEPDSTEDELNLMNSELNRVKIQLVELQTARAEFSVKGAEAHARRHLHKAQVQSALREAEEKDRKWLEKSKMILQEIKVLKEVTVMCEQERAIALEEKELIYTGFLSELGTFNKALLKKIAQTETNMEEMLAKRKL